MNNSMDVIGNKYLFDQYIWADNRKFIWQDLRCYLCGGGGGNVYQ